MLKSIVPAIVLVTATSACSGPATTVSDKDKVSIDCLASQTVVKITNSVKQAIKDGEPQSALKKIQATTIDAETETLASKFPKKMHEAYFEYETKRRLTAMQNALSNRSPDSPDQLTMDETMSMAKTCNF